MSKKVYRNASYRVIRDSCQQSGMVVGSVRAIEGDSMLGWTTWEIHFELKPCQDIRRAAFTQLDRLYGELEGYFGLFTYYDDYSVIGGTWLEVILTTFIPSGRSEF